MEHPSSTLTPSRTPALSVVIGRVALMTVAVTLIWLIVGWLADTRFGPDYSRLSHTFRAVLTFALAVPIVVLVRRFIDRGSLRGLGLEPLRLAWRPLAVGALCWLLPAAIGTALVLTFGWTEVALHTSLSEALGLALGLALLVFLYEAFPEELIFRGYLYRNLAAALPVWAAVLGQAMLFAAWGLINGGPISPERTALFFLFSLVLGVMRAVTGSVWATIGFHVAFQTLAQLFGTIGSQFTLTPPEPLTFFALGALPFALALTVLGWFYRQQPTWRVPEPEAHTPTTLPA